MVAVEDDPIGLVALRGELGERPQPCSAQRGRHAERIALLVGRVADADRHGPLLDPLGDALTLGPIELLRVPHAAEMLGRRHDGAHGHRARPGTAADLVDPDDDPLPRLPALSLVPEGGRRCHLGEPTRSPA